MKKLSILFVQDSALFRSAFATVLGRNNTLKTAACSSRSLLASLAKISEDVVLIDAVTWTSGEQPLVSAVERVALVAPVILLGREDLLEKHAAALRAGAAGFVKQTADPKILIKATRKVALGGLWFDREVFRRVLVRAGMPAVWPRDKSLNQKEQQILTFVVSGKTNKEIAAHLGFAERTVKSYMQKLFTKIGVTNRSSLTSYAILHGITHLTPDEGT